MEQTQPLQVNSGTFFRSRSISDESPTQEGLYFVIFVSPTDDKQYRGTALYDFKRGWNKQCVGYWLKQTTI